MQEVMNIKRAPGVREFADDIKAIVLPGKDQILNGTTALTACNAESDVHSVVLRQATVALQLSLREGFEVKVTEAILKGVPVIATRVGGIPLQVIDGKTGFLVESGANQAGKLPGFSVVFLLPDLVAQWPICATAF